jgi:hypothetical protein
MIPNINEQFFAVIEDFIDKDQAESLKSYIIENSLEDRRNYYKYAPLGDSERIFGDEKRPWDPDNIIQNTAIYAYNFFKSHYNLNESFVLDRVFGNIMFAGAFLYDHKDFSYGESLDHDPSKKTLVASLFLSDDYEGGEMAFFERQKFIVKPKVGTLMLFTGHSTRHGVKEILDGTRVNILYMFYYTDPETA